MKREEDGCYYEKVVTWKKKPKRIWIFYEVLLILLILFNTFILVDFANQDNSEGDIILMDFVSAIYFAIGFLANVLGIIYVPSWGEGKEKKIKYRRIGK